MSDSGSESSSSEGYDGRRDRVTSADNVASPNFSHHSSVSGHKSRASSISSREKSPESVLSERDSKSPRYTPISPKSQRSGLVSPSEVGSPRSTRSLSKSPPTSPKSYHSGNNSLDSPRSDQSLSHSPIQDERSCPSTPLDSKSLHLDDTEPKQFELEVDAQRSGDNSLKSYSYKNSESRQSSPKSPRSGCSSAKSLILSGRSSPKSGPASPMDDQESEKHSPPHSPPTKTSFNELDGEQISDGDIEDEPESITKSKPTPITHGEDLSDVSDLESIDGVDGTEHESILKENQQNEEKHLIIEKIEKEDKHAPVGLTEESEQLDFEADGQWKDERDEGEAEGPIIKENKDKDEKDGKDKDKDKMKLKDNDVNDKEEGEEDGEKVESELEEGELSDGDDARPEETEPRPVCRFYNRGQCTWGVSCRFLHPGVTDKGNYTMFDMVRPMAYPPHTVAAPHEFRPHIDRPNIVRPLPGYGAPPHTPKIEDLPTESAWERGLRHAKEMMRKANKRKESDMDFEEKKMNLSLGQDELDREAGYYVRAASPEPPVERWPPREAPRRIPPPRLTPERYIDDPDPYYAPPAAPPEYYRRVHYKTDSRVTTEYRERIDYHAIPRGTPHSVSPPPHTRERERERERERDREREYYEKYEKKHKRPSREVIVERIPPTKPWREEEPPPEERSRGDEWADPWMRRKSPSTVRRNTSSRRSRRQSYSSGSSYSSTSSSRSSSRSSYSSYDSLSRSRSPSPPSRTRGAGKGKAVVTSPPSNPPTIAATAPQRGAMLMNPPAPSPRPPKGSISPTTGTLHRRAGLNPPAPSPLSSHQRHHEKARDKAAIAAAAVAKVIKSRSRSRSSHSSSGSESSGSSSDSSESSYSSSSSETRRRKGSTPPVTRKDSKGIDALKLSGTKQQIKLTLKPTSNTTTVKKVDRSALMAGKKRGLESPPLIDSKASVAAAAAKAAKKASSRREELLKQLKAVEDAIARKRSKV